MIRTTWSDTALNGGSKVCWYCGCGGQAVREHQTPLTRGGLDHPQNIVIACWTCNNAKGRKTVEEFRLYQFLRGKLRRLSFHGEDRQRRDWLLVSSPNLALELVAYNFGIGFLGKRKPRAALLDASIYRPEAS